VHGSSECRARRRDGAEVAPALDDVQHHGLQNVRGGLNDGQFQSVPPYHVFADLIVHVADDDPTCSHSLDGGDGLRPDAELLQHDVGSCDQRRHVARVDPAHLAVLDQPSPSE